VIDQSKAHISDCKGLTDVAMATNLLPNMQKYHKMATTSVLWVNPWRIWFWHRVCAIREFICEIPMDMGQRDVTMATTFWPKLAKKWQKWPYLQLHATHPCRVGFWDRVCGIGKFCDTPTYQCRVWHWYRFCAIREFSYNSPAYKCISMRGNENVSTYNNGVFVVDQSKENICDCKGLRDVAMATKFWPK